MKLKKVTLLILSAFCVLHLPAQERSNLQLKLAAGIFWDWIEGEVYLSGPFLYVEPKLQTSANTSIGLRIGAAHSTQIVQTVAADRFYIDNDTDRGNGVFSFVPIFDFYFSNKKYRPYLSVGSGYYFLTTSKDVFINGRPVNEALKASVNNQIGFLLRGGFNLYNFTVGRTDLSNMTIGLEFNYIPKADVEISNGDNESVGTIDTSNVKLSIGYTFGKS
ncbi:MAG: hypothetical protein AAFY76_00705 [Cyanobacteria bacterium J06649_11]